MFNIIGKTLLFVIGAIGITASTEQIEVQITPRSVILLSIFVIIFVYGLIDLLKELKAWITKNF